MYVCTRVLICMHVCTCTLMCLRGWMVVYVWGWWVRVNFTRKAHEEVDIRYFFPSIAFQLIFENLEFTTCLLAGRPLGCTCFSFHITGVIDSHCLYTWLLHGLWRYEFRAHVCNPFICTLLDLKFTLSLSKSFAPLYWTCVLSRQCTLSESSAELAETGLWHSPTDWEFPFPVSFHVSLGLVLMLLARRPHCDSHSLKPVLFLPGIVVQNANTPDIGVPI